MFREIEGGFFFFFLLFFMNFFFVRLIVFFRMMVILLFVEFSFVVCFVLFCLFGWETLSGPMSTMECYVFDASFSSMFLCIENLLPFECSGSFERTSLSAHVEDGAEAFSRGYSWRHIFSYSQTKRFYKSTTDSELQCYPDSLAHVATAFGGPQEPLWFAAFCRCFAS